MISADTRVILLALTTAAFTTAGTFFQKLNGVRGANSFMSGWLILATICFFPTFVIANKVYLMGGKLSLFVPVTAMSYVLSMLTGRFYFGESVPTSRWLGCAIIVAGVATVARG